MDDFLSESIKKQSEIVLEVDNWQEEFLSKFHIKTC